MWKSSVERWRMLTVISSLLLGFIPIKAELHLDGIALNASYTDVLRVKGSPHYIGPTLEDANDVTNILMPPPQQPSPTATPGYSNSVTPGMSPTLNGVSTEMTIPLMASAGANPRDRFRPQGNPQPASPVVPNSPQRPGRSTTMGTPAAMTPSAPPQKRKGDFDYIVWLYQGKSKNGIPNERDGWSTYVIFDKKLGRVVEVISWLTNPSTYAPNGGMLGQSLTYITDEKMYGYPTNSTRIEGNLIYMYPSKQITFSFDEDTQKVIGIALGRKFLTGNLQYTPGAETQRQAAPSSSTILPGSRPRITPGNRPGAIAPSNPLALRRR